MPQGFGHPPQWDYQLPRMNDLLTPLPPSTRTGTASTLLPLPQKDPAVSRHMGGQSLAPFRSPWATERIPQGSRQDGLQLRSPVAHPLSRQVHDHDHHHIPRGLALDSYPLHSSTHIPIHRQEPGPTHSTYTSVGKVASYAVNGDNGLLATHLPHEPKIAGGAPSSTHVEQSSRPKPATGMVVESPWGFTKAGKARKRLEQACVSCRKKKTKCEPMSSSSKCSPCEKNGSECHFDSTPRTRRYAPNAYSSSPISPAPSLPILERQDSSSFSRPDLRSTATSVSNCSSRSSMDIGNLLSPSSPSALVGRDELERSPPYKRLRNGMAPPSMMLREASNVLQREQTASSPEPLPHHSPTVNALSWDLDPFEAMPDMTEHYLHHYFTNINLTSYCMFPRDKFLEWVRTDRRKTQAEKMLLYAMLAHGSIFSNKMANARNFDRKVFERIARGAIGKSTGRLSLPMLQTRLILGLLHYAVGSGFCAWDYCGMAIRAACGMKMNVEKGLQHIAADARLDFGFDKATLIECRRRTFWSAYIMDRYNGFCSGHMGMLQNGNCLLRLPCDEDAYARGEILQTPFFHTPEMDPKLSLQADRSGLGMMAYYVEVSSIWGDVLAHAYRSEYQPKEQYHEPAEAFYQEQMAKLDAWKASLAPHLHPSQDNIDKAFQDGYIGVFISLWLLYHCTAMKLCRHVRFQYMKPDRIDRNIKNARHHAHQLLDMMPALAKANREKRMPESAFIFSMPFTGYGILVAVDILTSVGLLAELPALLEQLSSGSEVMEEMAQHWSSAQQQWKMVGERFQNLLTTVHTAGATTGKTAFYAKMPMEVTFGLEHDLIYDLPLHQRTAAIGLKDPSCCAEELIEIRMPNQDAIDDSHWRTALDASAVDGDLSLGEDNRGRTKFTIQMSLAGVEQN